VRLRKRRRLPDRYGSGNRRKSAERCRPEPVAPLTLRVHIRSLDLFVLRINSRDRPAGLIRFDLLGELDGLQLDLLLVVTVEIEPQRQAQKQIKLEPVELTK